MAEQFESIKERFIYKDLLGKDREHVEAQVSDITLDTYEEKIVCKNHENRLIVFHFSQNEVNEISFVFPHELSAEQIIEEIGYDFSQCYKATETSYRIKTPAGTLIINIYPSPAGNLVSLSNFTKSLEG